MTAENLKRVDELIKDADGDCGFTHDHRHEYRIETLLHDIRKTGIAIAMMLRDQVLESSARRCSGNDHWTENDGDDRCQCGLIKVRSKP